MGLAPIPFEELASQWRVHLTQVRSPALYAPLRRYLLREDVASGHELGIHGQGTTSSNYPRSFCVHRNESVGVIYISVRALQSGVRETWVSGSLCVPSPVPTRVSQEHT